MKYQPLVEGKRASGEGPNTALVKKDRCGKYLGRGKTHRTLRLGIIFEVFFDNFLARCSRDDMTPALGMADWFTPEGMIKTPKRAEIR